MWPWKKRLEIVQPDDAGDDAVAALTMILRYYRKSVTFHDVKQAIYQNSTNGVPTAVDVVVAAAHFGLQGRGIALENAQHLDHIPTPNIAHMSLTLGQLPRRLAADDGYFAVVASTSVHRVRWIDPYLGNLDEDRADFLSRASGIFLVFDQAHPLPHAKARPGARN